MNLEPDFSEFIACLNAHEVRSLIVGGYAVGAHGLPRGTKALDVWVLADRENADALMSALEQFGFGDVGLTALDFIGPDVVVQLGCAPIRIDILTSIDGVEFIAAYPLRMDGTIDGLRISFIGREQLIANKRAAGRRQDLADADRLEGLE